MILGYSEFVVVLVLVVLVVLVAAAAAAVRSFVRSFVCSTNALPIVWKIGGVVSSPPPSE